MQVFSTTGDGKLQMEGGKDNAFIEAGVLTSGTTKILKMYKLIPEFNSPMTMYAANLNTNPTDMSYYYTGAGAAGGLTGSQRFTFVGYGGANSRQFARFAIIHLGTHKKMLMKTDKFYLRQPALTKPATLFDKTDENAQFDKILLGKDTVEDGILGRLTARRLPIVTQATVKKESYVVSLMSYIGYDSVDIIPVEI